jgi:hypothetical protein
VTTVTATRSELLSRELTRIQQHHLDRHDFPAEPGSGGAGR